MHVIELLHLVDNLFKKHLHFNNIVYLYSNYDHLKVLMLSNRS